MHPTPPPYRPPGVTGRNAPPWGTAPPTTPWPPKVMSWRERRNRRKDVEAAQRMLAHLFQTIDGDTKLPEELIVEAWLWLVAGEDDAAAAALAAAIERLNGELPAHWDKWWDTRKLTVQARHRQGGVA